MRSHSCASEGRGTAYQATVKFPNYAVLPKEVAHGGLVTLR
ncbi:MAG: hypothetical protein ABUL60_26305 [Myxococcales bacterium]